MSLKYEVLEDSHETSVYEKDTLIAVFFGKDRTVHAKRFAEREQHLADMREVIEFDVAEGIARAKRDSMLQGPGRN